jgi:APA family basic amino acid/polyamine antiporter
LTGLSYAELAARHPEAAGAAAYVKHAFGSKLFSRLVGAGIAASMLIAATSIAHGSAAYLQQFTALPAAVTASLIVVLFIVVECRGVRESVGIAALLLL